MCKKDESPTFQIGVQYSGGELENREKVSAFVDRHAGDNNRVRYRGDFTKRQIDNRNFCNYLSDDFEDAVMIKKNLLRGIESDPVGKLIQKVELCKANGKNELVEFTEEEVNFASSLDVALDR